MDQFNEFYPESQAMKAGSSGMWMIGMVLKLEKHLQNAKNGNREAESKLCNRIGQIRRHFEFPDLPGNIKDLVIESVDWLRTTGRAVDLRNKNPAYWISTRDGRPRW